MIRSKDTIISPASLPLPDRVLMKAGQPMSDAIETMRERALSAVLVADQVLSEALGELPAAIYVTDPDGVVTFNPTCIDVTGRRPEERAERWCVTWRLYTNAGDFLPHADVPWPSRSTRSGQSAE
jgi:PAS domain-containing protein